MEHLNLLQRIEKKSSEFSKGQRRLAQYITENYDIAAYLTASKLGKEAGVSESTVVRFAYQLDYEGYPELQKAIQVIVKTNSNSIQRMSLSSKRYQEKGVLKSILYTDAERLRDTIQSGVDEEEFNRSVMLINDARRLYILGARSAAYLAGLMGYYMYTNSGHEFMDGEGIIQKGVENTIRNVGRLARQGMRQTDDEILRIMSGK